MFVFSLLNGVITAKDFKQSKYLFVMFFGFGWILVVPLFLQIIGGYFAVLHVLIYKGVFLASKNHTDLTMYKRKFLERGTSLLGFSSFIFVLHRTYSFISNAGQKNFKMLSTSTALITFIFIPIIMILSSIYILNYFSIKLLPEEKKEPLFNIDNLIKLITLGDNSLKFMFYLATVIILITAVFSNSAYSVKLLELLKR